MTKNQFNLCDWCNPTPQLREPHDFIHYFVNLFGRRIEYPQNKKFDEESLVQAVENATVHDVMQAITYLFDHYKNDKELIRRMYEQLVYKRELWYSLPRPGAKTAKTPKSKAQEQKVVKVAEHTPWRYFHDVIRRVDFSDHQYQLVSPQKARYLICVEHISRNKAKEVEELGICDEHYKYLKCDCNFTQIKVLCSRCNSFVEAKQCVSDPVHRFSSTNVRCFRIDHGKILEAVETGTEVGDADYVSENVQVDIKHFDRFEKNRKSSRGKKSPKVSPTEETPPSYQEFEEKRRSPELVEEFRPLKEQPVPDSLKNPYDYQPQFADQVRGRPEIIGDRGTPPIVYLQPKDPPVVQPPARKIPVYDVVFEEPPPAVLPDEMHPRPTEGSRSPILRLPTPDGESDSINKEPLTPLREKPRYPPPQIPTRRSPPASPVKLREIPVHRETPYQPVRLSDVERPDPNKRHTPLTPKNYDFPPEVPDFKKRREPTPPLPPRDESNFNVVVMGPTGGGKSTWINALTNYLRYETLSDAKNNELFTVIPVKFYINDTAYQEYGISHGKFSENESFLPGQTSTQRPAQYKFRAGRNTVNIVDTPGVTDSRGLAQDAENRRLVLEEIRRLDPKQVHAIAIVLKANETRLGAALEQALISLLSMFPRSAVDNLAFFFTFSRGTAFEIGDTYNSLAKLFDQIQRTHGTRLTLSSESVYTVDNEAFRYLVVCAKKDPQLEACMLRFDDYQYSWHESQHESARFFDHLAKLRPVDVFEISAYNTIKEVAHELAKTILENEGNTEAYRLAYEVVLDYLIQNSIIVTDPLMKEVVRSKKQAPLDLPERYYVDYRKTTETVTKEQVYRYLDQFRGVQSLNYDFRRCIEEYVYIYEEHVRRTTATATTGTPTGNRQNSPPKRDSESFSEFPLSYGPGETTYNCLEERRTVITEKVHYFDSRPASYAGGTSIQSNV